MDESDHVAPFSWINPVSHDPPRLALALLNTPKKQHSLENIERTREFVVNIPDLSFADQLVECSYSTKLGENKFDRSGFTRLPSMHVSPPGIKECRAHFECKVINMMNTGDHTLIIADIVDARYDTEAYSPNYLIKMNQFIPAIHLSNYSLDKSQIHVFLSPCGTYTTEVPYPECKDVTNSNSYSNSINLNKGGQQTMGRIKLNKEDMDALLIGFSILGTGGGGDPEWGRKILENDFQNNRACEIVDIEDVEDDAFVCSGGIMGSVMALENMSYDAIVADWEDDFVLITAFKEMESIMGKKLDYIIPFEAGGLNTPVIMSLAARMGIPMINGDALGRSAPETQMTSFIGHNIALNPMPLVDAHGNTIVVMNSKESTYADEIGRFVVTKGGSLGGNAHYPMSGKDLKRSCVPGTITQSLEIGKTIIGAREKGKNPVEAFRKIVKGIMLFTGEIEEVFGEDKGGFYLTNVKIRGNNEFENNIAKMVIKNETMVIWINEEIKCIFPDMAFILNPQTGDGLMSSKLETGMPINIIGTPCHERLRESLASEEGKKAFGGARYGYDELQYTPFEELNNI